MRLHRITLTDYRGVASRTVEFAEHGVTIVAGPNEIGKTSLVEALDLLVEEKASSTRREILAVKPTGRDVGPAVEAELSFGRYRVVYRKQWIKGKTTELRVLSPAPEQLSGNPAHERFGELLHEAGIDLFLWRQLRVSQDWQRTRAQELRADGQSAIAGRPAVSGALQEQSAQVMRTGPEEALFERARQQYEVYFTPKRGETRGEYAEAREALDEANRAMDAAKQALAEAEGAIAEQARVRAELDEAALELAEARRELAEVERQQAELARLRRQVADFDADLAVAQQIEEATALLGRFARRSAELDDEIGAVEKDLAAAVGERDAAAARVQELRADAERLRAAVRLAGDDVQWHRDRQAAERLAGQVERAQDAADRVRAADLLLASNPVTEAVLEQIEAAHQRWDTAAAVLQANAATVEVTPLGRAEVTVEQGGLGAASPGGAASYPAVESITVEVPDAVRVVVTPGAGERERRDAERTSREAYRDLCAAAGVPDLAAAKDAQRRRRNAEDGRRAAVQERDTALADAAYDGGSLADLHEQLAALQDRIAVREGARPADPPAPATLEAAQAAEAELREAQEGGEERVRVATAAAAHEENRVVALTEKISSRRRQVELATADTALAEQRLKELPAARTASELTELRAARHVAAARIEELNPQQVEAQLATMRPLPGRYETEQAARRERLAALAAQIALLSDNGPEESLERAKTHQAQVQRKWDELHRDAVAAKLLFETLERHRAQAWQRYAEPFRALVEKHAAGVFGPGVGITVSEDLTVSAKTSGGSTVPFDQLSAGAREQLALLGRIACAELITPPGAQDVGGVPLILDDALGHTDRQRLNQLAAILDRAGSRVQIILLTHAPERFRIGTAHCVEL
jgi:energy-coupling factor transporter ATP-binding protein EcfA2